MISPEKFNVIYAAYSVLSHPEKRAAYDAGYENLKNRQLGMLSAEFQPSRSSDLDNDIRFGILSVLYAARRQDTEKPDIGMWRLEQMLGWPEKEIGFHIWFLKEKAWIYRPDTGGYAIAVTGAEVIEARKSGSCSGRLITVNGQHFDEPPASV